MDDHPSMIANSGLEEQHLGPYKRVTSKCAANDGEPCFQLSGTLREIRRKTQASRFTIYEGIYNGLETLLRSTMNDVPVVRKKGARSLFSVCLKAVPSYITEEEANIEETGTKSAIDTRDISTEIYDELECFGSSGHGWRQLKVIVRSHGIKVLGDAITAGLLDIDFCGVLVTLCIHTFATEEAKVLLSSLLSSGSFPAPKTLHDTAPCPFSMLWKFIEYTGGFSFQYHQLATLISKGVLPLGWLATKEFRPVWTGVIQRLSPESVNPDVLMFLETLLPLLAGSRQSISSADSSLLATVEHTFSSLLTTLVSIVILSREATNPKHESESKTSQAPYTHITTLLHTCEIQYRLSKASTPQGALLLVAHMIARAQIKQCTDTEGYLMELLQDQTLDSDDDLDSASTSYNDLVGFVCSIARCCGRGAFNEGFEYLEYLHTILEELSINSGGIDLFQGLIVDSAFAFAQQLPEQKHLNYASTLDAKFSGRDIKRSLRPISEANDDMRPGFRWEDGIGEWVMTTPIGNRSKRESSAEYPITKENESEPPSRAPPFLPQNSVNRRVPLARMQNLPPSDVSLSSESGSDDSENLGSMAESLQIGFNAEASDDELYTSFSNDDSSGFDVSASEAGIHSTETSFCSVASIAREDEYTNSRQAIDRAPRLSRKVLQKSQDWQLFDESFSSTASSSTSSQNEEVGMGRKYVDRAPRLGRRALRTSKALQLFDESDDELSCLSVSSQGDPALRDITNTSSMKSRPLRKRTTAAPIQRKSIVNWTACNSDSEDELGI